MSARQYLLVPRSQRDLELLLQTVQQHGLLNLMNRVQRSNLELLREGVSDLGDGFVLPVHLRPTSDRQGHLEYIQLWLGPHCSRIERVGPASRFD